MAIGGGMSCVKYLLFCFNLLFAITGLIILIAGIKAEINAAPYIDFTDENFYASAPIVLIIVGVIVFVVAFFGCCGAVKENHCMIITFSVFLIIIFIAELAVGIAGYMRHGDLESSLATSLNETMKNYSNSTDIKKSFDIMQTDLSCCGVYGPGDWKNISQPIPSSCCNGVEPCGPGTEPFHTDGCLAEMITLFKSISMVLGGVGLGIALVQLLGVIFACCLARSIRSQYETV